MKQTNEIMEFAKEEGASGTADIELAQIVFDETLRKSCEMNSCGNFKRNWMCPPYCGEISECIAKAKQYERGVVLQYIGELEDSYDFEGMMNAAEAFQKMFIKTVRYVRTLGWDIYPLGAGGCRNCERCAVIDGAPCRHPEEAFPSLESHGIFVSELAQKSGMNYINGQNTVTYFGAILYR